MARLGFSAAVDDWTRETKGRMEAVFKQASSDVIEEMQKPVGGGGNMPVDTGFLRASLVVGINTDLPPANRKNPGGGVAPPQAVDLAIAGAEIGDTIVAGYTANYAGYVNYGTSRAAPRQFVEKAAQQWQAIVSKVISRLRGR